MAIALIDASMVYAASRWVRRVHDDPRFDYRRQFRAADDESLFYEFLHNLVLYDEILLDNSSVARIGSEIEGLISDINQLARDLVRLGNFATVHKDDLYWVMRSAVRLLGAAVRGGYPIARLAAIAVPWSYRAAEHEDRPDMERLAAAEGLDPALIPLALFQYRGLCYAGYAASRAKVERVPVAYVAAPGGWRR